MVTCRKEYQLLTYLIKYHLYKMFYRHSCLMFTSNFLLSLSWSWNIKSMVDNAAVCTEDKTWSKALPLIPTHLCSTVSQSTGKSAEPYCERAVNKVRAAYMKEKHVARVWRASEQTFIQHARQWLSVRMSCLLCGFNVVVSRSKHGHSQRVQEVLLKNE